MSETYENFARETYATVNQEVMSAVEKSNGQPVIIFSATEHSDTETEERWNAVTSASKQEPAMASAYTHIAAIESAVRFVGAENVIVSFEFDQQILENRQALLKPSLERDDLTPERQMSWMGLEENPVYVAMYHAMEQGIETVASDPLRNEYAFSDPERFEGEIQALESLALRTEKQPQIVVHIGGTGHIAPWQGYTMDRDIAGNIDENISRKDPKPFDGIYGSTVYFNSFQEAAWGDDFESTAVDYARDSNNAVQIDPPGKMDESDRDFETIIQRVQTAADKQIEVAPTLETAPEVTSDTLTTPRTP